MSLIHGLSVDVEDWFHILESDRAPKPTQWDSLESRVTTSTGCLLDLLARYSIRATFFVLGWVAQRHPELIAQVAERGHEIGSHGHMHQMVSHLTPDEFARDLDRSLKVISRASGCDMHAYRAPGFSITQDEFWAFEILASRGILLDSSLFLCSHAHGGISLKRNRPFELVLPNGRKLIEVPVVPWRLSKWNLPYSGGGYLRLLPAPMLKSLFKVAQRQQLPAIAYLHPRDLDPQQPRMALPFLRSFKYYVGLKTMPQKLEQLFESFRFSCFQDVVQNTHFDKPLHVTSSPSTSEVEFATERSSLAHQ